MEEVAFIEYEFRVKDIDIEIQTIEAQIARLQLEKDKLNHSKIGLAQSFRDYITSTGSRTSENSDVIEEVPSEIEEIKPRRLKN